MRPILQDFLKEPFNLIWIFWQPIETCILDAVKRRQNGQSVVAPMKPTVVAEKALQALKRVSVDESVPGPDNLTPIDDPELQLVVGCQLYHYQRGRGTLVRNAMPIANRLRHCASNRFLQSLL